MDPKKTAPLAPGAVAERVLRHIPEARELANIDMQVLFNLDSANMQPNHWEAIARAIAQKVDEYDGFVVIHGTDTMAYTAAALSYMLTNLGKPVILTGAQRPIAAIRTDARTNLVQALELATCDIPEVGLYFSSKLFRGNRALKASIDDFDAFASPNFPALAEVGLNIDIRHGVLRRPTGLFHLQTGFSNKILSVRLFPGLRPESLMQLLETDIKAFLLEGYGAGTVPSTERSVIPFIREATAQGKMVTLTSQAQTGRVEPAIYEAGCLAIEAGAISCQDMTPTAALVKLMFLLGQFDEDPRRAARAFSQSIAGELTP